MTQFLTVIALNLTSVTWCSVQTTLIFLLFMSLTDRSCIDSGGQGGAFLTFSISLALFLLLFFSSIFGKLKLLGTWQWFCSSDPRFFRPGVFYGATLVLDNGGVGWLLALEAVLIYLFSARARSESRLGFGINGFLDYLIKAFQLKVSVF